LRISFLGGGTDFPWFFEKHGGAVLSTSISKFIYISSVVSFDGLTTYLKYSKLEAHTDLASISHPIFRSVLLRYNMAPRDWAVMADIPAGNGLASSSAFTVGLINAASRTIGKDLSPSELAYEAAKVELDLLQEPIGIQDQFASALGGMNLLEFKPGRKVSSRGLFRDSTLIPFDIVLVKVGVSSRSASRYTEEQTKANKSNPQAIRSLIKLKELTLEAASAIEGEPAQLAKYVRAGWQLKVQTNPNAVSSEIEETLDFGMKNGAEAGKLLGAGGSGFVMLLVDTVRTDRLIDLYAKRGQMAFHVKIEESGSKVILDE
jgi:D-glycero-alpha-D-manno-heptose-7-phosphate kinase